MDNATILPLSSKPHLQHHKSKAWENPLILSILEKHGDFLSTDFISKELGFTDLGAGGIAGGEGGQDERRLKGSSEGGGGGKG